MLSSNHHYRVAMERLILAVDPEVLGGANGIAWHGVGYVRKDWPL
ncbi:MAG: hypothetical protein ACRERE_11870 [Candidatus Entotheonellia bacterium]